MQQAVRSTVVSLLGNLPPHMYDTSIASTGQVRVRVRVSLLLVGLGLGLGLAYSGRVRVKG